MLLTNWLTKLTSRISKRRVFRSRDRRDIRKRWQSIIHNQISTTEALEDRTLLTTFFVDDDFTGASDFSGTDTDPGTVGDQNAVFGVTAFATIQDALGFVADGDTIMVAAGIYNETGTMVIDDEISIIGEGKDVVEIRKAGAPASSFDEVISITANNVTISGAQLGWETHTAATDYLGYVVTTVADNTTLNNLLFSDNYRSAVVFQNADNLEVSDSIFEGTYGRAAIRDGNGGSGENFLITRNEFREDHYRWGPIAIGPQGTFGDPNNFAFSGEISYNYFANGLEAGAFQEEGDQNYTVTITNQGMTVDGLNIIHNTFDWQDSATVNQVGNYAQSAGVYIDPGLSTPGPVNISDNIFTGFTYEGPQPSTDPLWGAAGVFGTALEFDGVDDYGFFESALFDVGTAGTLNFWINMHDTSRRNMFFEGLEGIGFEFQYRENSGGQFYGSPERDVSSNNYVIQDGAAAAPNVWQNLQYTWDFNGGVNPQMHIYIDGVEVGYLSGTHDSDLSQWVATVNTATQLITVGKDASGGRFFDGLMDDIGWFNAVLDGTDRDNIRNNGVAALAADARLVAHWDFDEVAGTTAVDNKNGIVMYIVADGIAPFGPEFQETGGQFGGALEFDGIDDFATFQDATFDVGETGTLNFWVNMQDQSRRNQFFEGLDDLGFEFQYRENSGGQFFGSPGREGNGENVAIQNGGAGGTEGVWQNLQYTWDYNGGVSPQIHIYVDGTEVGYLSTSYDSDLSGWVNIVSSVNRLVTVGMDAGGGRYFDGLMDDVAWFDEVLTTGELAEIRGTSVGTSSLNGDSRLVAYWNLDDASGTTVASGNGGTNIDLLIQQKPALPPVQGVGVIAPSGVNLTNNIFTGNDLDSNLSLDPSNQTGTLDLLYAKDSDPLFVPTDSLAEQYRVGFGSPAAYMSSDIDIDPATPFPHIGAYQGFPGYYGTGDILIYGTNDNDLLNITFTAEDEATFTFTRDVGGPGEFTEGPVILTGITSFTFFGLEGDDTLRITNPAGGLVNPVNGITFNGGTGGEVVGDTLEILGGTATSVLHTFDNANDGSVSFNGEATATITYTGLEPVLDTILAGDRTFNFTGGAETITLSDVGPNNDGISQIDSDDLGELVNFLNPTDNIFINTEVGGGSGADIVNIIGLDTLFDANLTVNAGADDTINTGTVDIGAGNLNLTAGQVNVNGAFTTTGTVDIDGGNIVFDAVNGSINAGSSLIELTAATNVQLGSVTTLGEVRVTATAGAITDNSTAETANITADSVALRAATGIGGNSAPNINTSVNTLAARTTTGDLYIANDKSLDVNSVDLLNGLSAAGDMQIVVDGALTVNQSVSGGSVQLRTTDAAAAGQDINVNAGVTSTSSFLTFQAGDDFNLASGVTIDGDTILNILVDYANADAGTGGTANLFGTVISPIIVVAGGTDADTVIIDSNGGTASDGGNVDGIQGAFTFNGNVGADQLILDDSGDTTGDTISITRTGATTGAVNGAGLSNFGFNFLSPATVTLNTGTDTDDISVELGDGSPDVNITSAGGADSLTVLGRTGGDDLLVATPGAIGTGSGTIQDLGFPKTIDFDGITGSILIDGRGSATTDLVTVLGTAAVDTTTIGPSGPVLLAEIDPTLVTIGVQGIDVLAVDTGDSEDVIEVSPDLNIAIDINGGDPTAPATPGDQLTYLTPSGEGSNYTPTGTDSGTITATGGFQIVTFDEIETVTLGGSVTVTGTAADDVLTITATSANSGTYQIVSGGVPGPVVNINSITDFTFNGGDGDDVLIIDNSGITPTAGSDLFNPVNGIFFNGQGNTVVGDSLQILGGDATTVEHRFTNANDGFVFYDGEATATITYTGLEPILDSIAAANRIFSYTGGDETITLDDDAGAVADYSQIGSTLGELVTFLNPTDSLVIDVSASGGSDTDVIDIEGIDANFDANLSVIGSIGDNDSVNFEATDIGSGNLFVNVDGTVTIYDQFTTTGTVDISGGLIDFFFPGAFSLSAGAGLSQLNSDTDIQLGQFVSAGDVALTAVGAIIDVNAGANNITANNATLTAGTGVGVGNALETAITALEADIGGGLELDNTGTLDIGFAGGINGVTVGGPSTITSTGTMTVTENVTATGGDLLLQNTGGDFVLNALAIISNNSTFEIGIDSVGAVTLADTSTVTSSGTGLIDIDAVNDIALANVNTGGEVQVTTSAGAITDISGSEAALITADTAALRAATGIGAAGAGDIDLAVGTVSADTSAGDIFIESAAGFAVGTVDLLAGITALGNISVVTGGTLTVDDIIEATGAAATILVDAQADIDVNSTIETNGGAIDLLADNDLNLNAASVVDTNSAAVVTLTADSDISGGGAFVQTEGSVVNAQGGALNVTATDDISLADLQSAGGIITIDSSSGSIVDNTVAETALISGGQLSISALNGIGSSTGDEDIETAVGTLSAITTNNDVVISNTGALLIGDVAPLSGVTSSNGAVSITTASPLTVGSNVTAAGTVTLTSTDAAGPGDDLTINGGVTVESTAADVVLNSGDDFLLTLGGTVRAATTIEINVDPITDGTGATVDLLGNVDATLTTINGGDDSDTFNILPTQDSPITINGGDPTLPTVPGDVLNMDFSGLTSDPVLTLGVDAGSGTFSFLAPDTELPVNYSSIENVNTSAGAYHLVLNMFVSGFQDAAADTIDATVDNSGTDLILDINGGNFFTGAVVDILSFTVVGSTDDETLNINENATGGLPFFQEAAPAVTGSAGSNLNASANTYLDATYASVYTVDDITIHYDGGAGTDSVNVNFTTDHNAAYFSEFVIGAPGSGNITSSTTAGTDIDLGLSFARVEDVGFSGTADGELRVDASSNSFTNNIAISDDGTPADGISQIVGNMQFSDVLFQGFSDLQILSGTGDELLDLIGLDSATTLTNVVLNAGDISGTDTGNDTIRVRSTPVGTVTNVSVMGGLGDDLIQIFDSGNTVDNIFAAIQVFGGGGTDTLTLIDSGDGTGDTFAVTSTTIDGITGNATVDPDVTFTDIDALNVTGTSGNDTINVNLGAQLDLNTVTINGSDGDDTFNLNNSTPAGVDTRLNGNAGMDEFIFLASNVLRGFIDGGADVDTIDYSGYTPAVHVALSAIGSVDGFQGRENNGSILGTGIASLAFDNIDDLVGTAGVDTLEGPDLRNYWGITSTDEGFIIADRVALAIGRPTTPADATATPPEERLDFTSFQNLIGGSQDDRFDLTDGAGLTGTLNGGSGNDSLDYRDFTTAVTVNLFAGTATNIGGGLVAGTGGGDDDNSIENVFGGDGNDNITGDNDNNILGDGLGSDFLDGGGNGVGSGNGGNDVFLMEPGAGGSADVIIDIHGNDTIDFRFASAGITFDVDIINTPQDVFGGNTVELRQIQPQQPDTNPSFMENVVGSQFDDYIYIDPLSQDGNFPIDGPPVLRSADGQGGTDVLDFDAKGQEVIDTGFSLTADGVGTVQYLNFENITPFEDNPAFIVDNGDPGFTITGDWPYHPENVAIDNGIGFEDDIHSVPGFNPIGTGPAQAFWEFFGLTPGVYRVSVTWPESSDPFVATDAPFTIYDGARTEIGGSAVDLGTYDVNQQVTPDDYSADGANWEILDTFTVNSRTLTVMLTNLANGRINADAIRIERVSDGPEIELVDVTDALAPPALIVDGHPDGIQFGPTELLTDAVRTFEITNNGSAVLNISNISLPAGYTTDLTAQAIGIGDTISFTITMGSTTFGDRYGIFSFDTNDVDESTFNILLDGQVSNVVIIDNGDSDFSATAGFVNYATGVNAGSNGYEGDISGAVPNDPGNTPAPPTETATWTFTGLAEGNYRVSTTWSQLYNRVTDAPYSINGGAIIEVDQSVAPSSFIEDGVAWFDLSSSFTVGVDGELIVTLTNEASNFIRDNYGQSAHGVIADAIRIEYLPEPDLEITVDGGTVVDDDTGIVDFGSTIPGIPVIKEFTITNLSADDVDVTGLIEFPPGFSIDPTSPFGTDNVPFTIAGGGSVVFRIQFDGGTNGTTFGQISFTTGDADENPFNFTVRGESGPATVGINDSEFTPTGTWEGYTPSNVGDPLFLTAGEPFQTGTGANTATWDFVVEPGRYQVVAHWYVNPDVTMNGHGAASNAPYTIFGGALPVTVLVNQRVSSNDFLDDGINWEYIGNPVEITGNSLSVQLTDLADGLVYADEIRIYRVVDPVVDVVVDGDSLADGGTVNFDDTIVGAPVVKTFTVTNYGERNMALGPITVPGGFSLVSPLGSTNLAPGASTTFTLQMNASSAGSFSGVVSFGVDSSDANPFNFTVSGSASDSMIIDNGDIGYSTTGDWVPRYATSVYDYYQNDQDELFGGDQPGSNTASWEFSNLAEGTYRISSHWASHSGLASNAQFVISGIQGGDITVFLDQRFAANDFTDAGVSWETLGTFQVAAGGTFTITLLDDGATGKLAADAMRLDLLPSGTVAPEIEVAAGAVNLTSGSSSLDLGTAFYGESLFQTFTVTNTGTDTLNLGAVIPPAGFSISVPLGTTTLYAGQSTTFEVEFNNTTAAGLYSGTLTIPNDDADEAPFTIDLSATMNASLIVDDGDAGFSSTGDFYKISWVTYFEGDTRQLLTGANGTATWDFSSLTAGSYTVYATWATHGSLATNAEYSINAGGPIVVNQRVAPNDLNSDGANWEILGVVNVLAGGSISVELTDNNAADGRIRADAIRIERTGPLMAAAGVSPSSAPAITQSDLDSVRDAALNYWKATGLSETQISLLESVSFVLADLPDAMLGGATTTTILIDINAAGYGWFVDDTPFDSSEFSLDADGDLVAGIGSAAFGQMDLLTVVLHEMGHTLGYDDLDGDDSLMGDTLDASERRLPGIDDFFSGVAEGDNPLLD